MDDCCSLRERGKKLSVGMVEQEMLDLMLAHDNNSLQLIFEDADMQEVLCSPLHSNKYLLAMKTQQYMDNSVNCCFVVLSRCFVKC